MIRVVIADDHSLVRTGLRRLLEDMGDVEVVAEAREGREALALVKEHAPDVLVLDLAMPDLNGFEVLTRMQGAGLDVATLALSMHEHPEYVVRVFATGGAGYLVKAGYSEEFEIAVRALADGQRYVSPRVSGPLLDRRLESVPSTDGPFSVLTKRQREVLQLIAEGHSTSEIAEKLFLSPKTVGSHRAELQRRLGIHDVAGLVRYALRHGLASAEG